MPRKSEQQAELMPLFAVLQQRRLEVANVGQQAKEPAPVLDARNDCAMHAMPERAMRAMPPPVATQPAPTVPVRPHARAPIPMRAAAHATLRQQPAKETWSGLCACKWADGPYCEALLRAHDDTPRKVGEHLMRGGTDQGCPGWRKP